MAVNQIRRTRRVPTLAKVTIITIIRDGLIIQFLKAYQGYQTLEAWFDGCSYVGFVMQRDILPHTAKR